MTSEYLLSLNAHPNIGSQTIKKALAAFGTADKIWSASSIKLEEKLGSKISSYILEARQIDPEEQIRTLQRLDIGYLTMYDKKYPRLLKELHDAPVVLYIKGDIDCLNNPSVAIVGSRKYSYYGKKVADELAKACSQNGIVVVSGMALGIDAVVHKSCVDNDGITIGVLGCGLDKIYPTSNFFLSGEVIKKGGALISEFSPGTPPLKHHFPARNRIIAGLTLGTVVVEAAQQSGALITAYQALEYNREVFAVPGNIDAPNSAGTNRLIKEGARVVTEIGDITSIFNIESKTQENISQNILPESDEERIIFELLAEESFIDLVVVKTGLNIIAVNTALTMMEMKGLVVNLGGGRFKRR